MPFARHILKQSTDPMYIILYFGKTLHGSAVKRYRLLKGKPKP